MYRFHGGDVKKFGLFFKAMFSEWGSALSGPASVPFTIFAFIASNNAQKVVYAAMAIILGYFSAYRIWAKVHAEKTALEARYADEKPTLGLRIVYSVSMAEFQLLHLKGRPAVNVTIDPVRSLAGNQRLVFDVLPYVASGQVKQIVTFDVLEGDRTESTDPRILRTLGASGMLQIFLDDRPQGMPSPSFDLSVRFADDGIERFQNFKATFHLKRFQVEVKEVW